MTNKSTPILQKSLYIIDFSALAYRSYYAFIKNPLMTKQGENTSAIFGFISTIFRIIKEKDPTYIIIAKDLPSPTFRHRMYPEYKSQRKVMPDELRQQFPIIQEFLDLMKIPSFSKENYEADDVMASIAIECQKENIKSYLVTKDKDLMQIINSNIVLYEPGTQKQPEKETGSLEVKEKFDVEAKQIRDFLALMGDASDNIPGVPKIGTKTAAKILNTYSNIEEVYAKINIISPTSLQSRLVQHKDLAMLSLKLVTLETNLSFDLNFESMKTPADFDPLLSSFLNRWECHSFLPFLQKKDSDVKFKKQSSDTKNYTLIRSLEDLKFLFLELSSSSTIAIDTKTTGLNSFSDLLVGVSFSVDKGNSFYIPLRHPSQNIPIGEFQTQFQLFLNDSPKTIIFHNAKFDLLFLSHLNISFKKKHQLCDTLIAAYLLNPGQRNLNLNNLGKNHLNLNLIPIENLIGQKKSQQILFSEISVEKAYIYACEDADVTFRLWKFLKPLLKEEKLLDLLWKQEIPLLLVLIQMEKHGINLNSTAMEEFSKSLKQDIEKLEEEIYHQAGESFNIRSTQQLGKILYEKLGLISKKKTKTGLSTDMSSLEKLKAEHTIIPFLLQYRELTKLQSTYVEALPKLINPSTQRIHTSFSQTVVATGRLSSVNPNLQNIPIRTKQGKQVRSYFVPAKGYTFLSIDYSQIELRVLAHLSQDPILLTAYQNDEDIHTKTASILFKTNEVTEHMRHTAKSVNFGVIYGMGPKKLSSEVGVSMQEAKNFIKTYFNEYRGIQNFMNDAITKARRLGYSITLFNRKRLLPDLVSNNSIYRENAERMAINTPIQGTAADIMKLATIKIQDWIDTTKLNCKMLLQVHDELVFEVQNEILEVCSIEIKKIMENIHSLNVPLKVNIGVGQNWLEAHA